MVKAIKCEFSNKFSTVDEEQVRIFSQEMERDGSKAIKKYKNRESPNFLDALTEGPPGSLKRG